MSLPLWFGVSVPGWVEMSVHEAAEAAVPTQFELFVHEAAGTPVSAWFEMFARELAEGSVPMLVRGLAEGSVPMLVRGLAEGSVPMFVRGLAEAFVPMWFEMVVPEAAEGSVPVWFDSSVSEVVSNYWVERRLDPSPVPQVVGSVLQSAEVPVAVCDWFAYSAPWLGRAQWRRVGRGDLVVEICGLSVLR